MVARDRPDLVKGVIMYASGGQFVGICLSSRLLRGSDSFFTSTWQKKSMRRCED